ncbi:hypothetical protein A1D29_03780 [Pasteurellaceae bacterium Orientalotternb1]|nr:hypothetical protein A1D29_03780 [Pasteurellaceae bacterium Orientalotternb1]
MIEIEGIAETLNDLLTTIYRRYPNLSKGIYDVVFLITWLYLWLFDEMAWWSAAIFSLFLTLIFATLLILLLHFGVKLGFKWLNFR